MHYCCFVGDNGSNSVGGGKMKKKLFERVNIKLFFLLAFAFVFFVAIFLVYQPKSSYDLSVLTNRLHTSFNVRNCVQTSQPPNLCPVKETCWLCDLVIPQGYVDPAPLNKKKIVVGCITDGKSLYCQGSPTYIELSKPIMVVQENASVKKTGKTGDNLTASVWNETVG